LVFKLLPNLGQLLAFLTHGFSLLGDLGVLTGKLVLKLAARLLDERSGK
jgi:hypothetical protein